MFCLTSILSICVLPDTKWWQCVGFKCCDIMQNYIYWFWYKIISACSVQEKWYSDVMQPLPIPKVVFCIHKPGPPAAIFIPSMPISVLPASVSVTFLVSLFVFHPSVSAMSTQISECKHMKQSFENYNFQPALWQDLAFSFLLPFCRFGAISVTRAVAFARWRGFAVPLSGPTAFSFSVFGPWGFSILFVWGVSRHLQTQKVGVDGCAITCTYKNLTSCVN